MLKQTNGHAAAFSQPDQKSTDVEDSTVRGRALKPTKGAELLPDRCMRMADGVIS